MNTGSRHPEAFDDCTERTSTLGYRAGTSRLIDRERPQAYGFMTHRVCPNPIPWNNAYQRLLVFAQAHPCDPAEPPVPLILAGWNYSNDLEKKARWDSTIEWAAKHDCSELLKIPDDQFYSVDSLTSYAVGPTGGPMFRQWDFQTKDRPSDERITKALEFLRKNWDGIVGKDLARITSPLRFSGSKLRSLIVRADSGAEPPWGKWTHISEVEEQRRTFTTFRAAINRAVSPHEVDHIHFVITEDA
jgi:hypothetical protein